ncbi:MAG: FlgD immunoglobulin-like domain containing protein [bacterium]
MSSRGSRHGHRIDSGARASLLPALVAAFVALAPVALAGPPNIGPTTFLAGDGAIGPAAGNQTTPWIARGGDQYLIAWEDDRGASNDICAARVDANGVVLDTTPIAITQAAGTQTEPRVAWNGSNWLVTWQSQVPTQFYYGAGVLAVRVSPQGQILDPTPITVIAYQNSSGLLYALATDGTNWAVVSEGTSAGEAAIRGVRVAPDGTVLDPGGVVVVPETYYLRFGIDLGGLPGEFLLVWNEWRSSTADDILAYRLTPSLAKIDASPIVLATRAPYETNAKVASNGTSFFVAWDLNDNYLFSEVYGTRVSFSGQVMDPNGQAFSSSGPGYGRDPSVTWDGTNWIVSWPNYGGGGLNAARMSPTGAILDPGGVSMPSLGWGSIAGAPGGGLMATWSDATGGSQDAYAAPVSGALVPGAKVCASLGAPRQTQASFAFNGNGYLVVFLSARSAGNRVLGQRLDASGNSMDAEPFEIAGPTGSYSSPSVAWDGSRYMATYVSGANVYARRIAPDGSLLDPSPILVMNGMESGVAALDGVFLVVGNYAPQNPQYVFVFGTRVRGSDGAKLDASPLALSGSFALRPKVARLGSRWLAIWEQHPTHDDPHASVVGNFMDGSGAVGAAFGIGGLAAYNLAPSIAAGDTALVAWAESRQGFNNLDIYGRRVLANGALLDPGELALSVAPNSQTLPAIGWDGAEFATLFQDPRNIPYFFDEHLDVYGTRVSASGLVGDPAGFAVASDPIASEIQPAVGGGNGAAVLACSIYRAAAPYGAFRIGSRLLTSSAATAVVAPTLPTVDAVRLSATPNPSALSFELRVATPAPTEIGLSVFDVRGREVRRLYQGAVAGEWRLTWDGRDAAGHRVPSGVYFARLRSEHRVQAVKLTLR